MVKGIEHTAIASQDPQKLAEWYVKVLGFRVNYQSSNSRTVFIKAEDGSMIEIIEAGRAAQGEFQMNDPGIRHLALTVEDFSKALEALKQNQVKLLGDPIERGGTSLVFFNDPDGNILHLLKRQTPLP